MITHNQIVELSAQHRECGTTDLIKNCPETCNLFKV